MKRYIVTGAAGHLGSTILRLLLERGHNEEMQIRALLLPKETPAVEDGRIQYFRGDVRDKAALAPLFAGGNGGETIVLHTAGIITIASRVEPAVREVNVGGTANMLEVSRQHHVQKFVHVSSVHAIPEAPIGETIREVNSFSAGAVTGGYAKTKAEATQLVLDAAAEGLPAVIVHPSGIIGPYDPGRNHLVQLVRDFMKGKLAVCVRGGYDFVDVRDVAEGCLLAAERGVPGQCYILSGHYLSVKELLTRAGTFCGRKGPAIIPLWLARLAAPLIEGIAKLRKTRPLYTGYSLHTLTSNGCFSNEKAKQDLGYRTRPVDETIRDMVDYLSKMES